LDAVAPEHFVSLTHPWERTPLDRDDFTPAHDFVWTSSDGLEIHGWLYRTDGKPRGTIVHVHGGPTWHTQDAYYPRIQYLARAGFNVLDPNYRGSTGFGMPFQNAIKKTSWGGMEQEDIRTGIEALIERGIAEPGKIGIMGVSYGGYSSWCAITRLPRELVAAAAPICGMTDLVIDYETTRPDLRPFSAEMMGGTPQEVPERFYERSPIHFVDRIEGELLIVQGMQDPNVTPENVRAVVEKLQQADIEYSVLAFEDEGHGVYKPKNVRRLLEEVTEFFGNAFGT
jgi:dipeptidyl aminopeptidase/acylaminoacyl peptidase